MATVPYPLIFRILLLAASFIPNAVLAQQRGEVARPSVGADEAKREVFSGPQVGEPLGEVPVWVTQANDKPSTKVDLGKLSQEAPIVIAFMHEKSRPAFQLGRILSAFAELRQEQKLQLYFVVLTDDRSSSEKWLGQVRGYLGESTQFAVADGGIEGPGSLGLNRLVAMTILVAKDQKVTANFALTQVTASTDAPPILKAMNEVSGGGEIPSMEKLSPPQRRQRTRPNQ